MQKSRLLYGLPVAIRRSGPIVVCEGVTDVWRLKSNAVAVFGKSVSTRQRDLLVGRFAGRPLVLFFDSDAADQTTKALRALRTARTARGERTPVVAAELPDQREDVGDCPWQEAWSQVARALGRRFDDLQLDLEA